MEWTVILSEIFQVVLIPLLALVVKYFVQFVNLKADELKAKNADATYQKYITMLNETIVNAVVATNQTYVDELKAQGKFDAEAQKIALQKSYDTVLTVLGEDAQKYLTSAVGDLNAYIMAAIERQVNANKIQSPSNQG